MRARLTLIPLLAAVLLAMAPVLPAQAKSSPSGVSGRGGWFSSVTIGLDQRVEPVVRAQVARGARLAAVAAALTTPPPPLPPPPPPPSAVTTRGAFRWPAGGAVTSPFGPRWGRRHTGLDIDGVTGAPVTSAKEGIVKQAGWNNAYGLSVTVDHGGGITTLYAHLSKVDVRVGGSVGAGTYLGALGATGQVTGDHLHFEVLQGGEQKDPMLWL